VKQPLTSQAHTYRPHSTRGRGQIIETKAKTEAKQPEAKAEAEASRIWPRDRGQASRPNIPGG